MYQIIRYRNTSLGYIKEILGYHMSWYRAINCKGFESVQDAVNCIQAVSTLNDQNIRIEGPRGGIYNRSGLLQ